MIIAIQILLLILDYIIAVCVIDICAGIMCRGRIKVLRQYYVEKLRKYGMVKTITFVEQVEKDINDLARGRGFNSDFEMYASMF